MSTRRLPSLDLLRGTAAFGVAIPHLLLFGFPGDALLESIAVLGVEIFFVLSGFVLAPQIIKCFERPRHLPTFLVRRWMRTIPPYLLALVCISLIAGQTGTVSFFRYAVYWQNFFRQENTPDYFSIAWSLSVEEWFYIIFPACLLLARIAVPPTKRRALDITIAFILIVSMGRLVFGDYQNWGAEVRRVTVFRVDAIAYGVLLFLVPIRPSRRTAIIATLAVGLISAACLQQIVTTDTMVAKVLFPFTASAFGAAAILLALSFDITIEGKEWLSRGSLWMGRISFSTYLFHPIIALLLMDRLQPIGFLGRLGICLLAVVAFSVVFYLLFERPILRARPDYQMRVAMRAATAVPAASLRSDL